MKPKHAKKGRPKKSKIQTNIVGEVLPLDYGPCRFLLDSIDLSEDTTARIISRFLQELADAEIWVNQEKERKETVPNPIMLERTELESMLSLLSARVHSLMRYSDTTEELLELALAFTVGQLAVTARLRKKESEFLVGTKLTSAVRHSASLRRIKRPAKRELFKALKVEIEKHGKRTLAINNISSQFGVSKNTLRNWITELSIDF